MGVNVVMFAVVARELTVEEVRRESARMCSALGSWRYNVYRPGRLYGGVGQHALEIAEPTDLDHHAMQLRGAHGTILCVHISTRYYGPGYERGDLVSISATARWLRDAFKPTMCEVYYGGDSGDNVTLFDDAAEAALWDHLRGDRSRAYFDWGSRHGGQRHVCDFCNVPTMDRGGSDTDGILSCGSCGGEWRQDRRTGAVEEVVDRFDAKRGERPVTDPELERLLAEVLAARVAREATIGSGDVSITCMRDGSLDDQVRLQVRTAWGRMDAQARGEAFERAADVLMRLAGDELRRAKER